MKQTNYIVTIIHLICIQLTQHLEKFEFKSTKQLKFYIFIKINDKFQEWQ